MNISKTGPMKLMKFSQQLYINKNRLFPKFRLRKSFQTGFFGKKLRKFTPKSGSKQGKVPYLENESYEVDEILTAALYQ